MLAVAGILNYLLLGQNYHLIHHLWTTIRWYRYRLAFEDVAAELIARSAPVGWQSRAQTPSPS
jgi:beta-carotene hydroxylase